MTGRDGTPGLSIYFDKEIDYFGELFRYISFQKLAPQRSSHERLRVAVAHIYSPCQAHHLPAVTWDEILRYQLDIRHRPCNFVEIMPRLESLRKPQRIMPDLSLETSFDGYLLELMRLVVALGQAGNITALWLNPVYGELPNDINDSKK